MDRRAFLKVTGVGSLSMAVGCGGDAEKTLYSLVHAPDDMVTGKAGWYASTCRECPAGCGVLAKNREGRVIKLEGNPLHPVNLGALCMRGQAALCAVYNPDRIKTPLVKDGDQWKAISYEAAQALLKQKITEAAARGSGTIRFLSELVGRSTHRMIDEFLHAHHSAPVLLYEPFACEALKTANDRVFGVNGLVGYHMESADFLLCFGADFLDTWLSPVEYARKFKDMHGYGPAGKSLFVHVGPYQSLTAVNADIWASVLPASEDWVALGLIREAMTAGKGDRLPTDIRRSIFETVRGITPEVVVRRSDILTEHYRQMADGLLASQRPLILGQGMAADGGAGLRTHIAANLLNLVMDPDLKRIDFTRRYRLEAAASRRDLHDFFEDLAGGHGRLLLLNHTNPVFTLPHLPTVAQSFDREDLFVVSFTHCMDETALKADLVFPVALPLERWGEYGGKSGIVSLMQPTMGSLTGAPGLTDVLTRLSADNGRETPSASERVFEALAHEKAISGKSDWLAALGRGGVFDLPNSDPKPWKFSWSALKVFHTPDEPVKDAGPRLIATPSPRFWDGRGANKPWLCEHPDPITQVAWQSPVLMHPDTLTAYGLSHADQVEISVGEKTITAPAYEFPGVRPGVLVMGIGQGHTAYGRYARGFGANPMTLLPQDLESPESGPSFMASRVTIRKTGRRVILAHTDGSRTQKGRKIAVTTGLKELRASGRESPHGLGMNDFPLTLPLPEGYDPDRDFYPPHDHRDGYRWGMAVDLDRCIGCGACSVACYAENNIPVVGEKRIIEGREMAWLRIERYHDPEKPEKIIFLPMMCQHCDNAPCESVCPVYAPHHGAEGLNNQIYNRCIGTRYCSQNCPYKVRRFNWFEWDRPKPTHLQLNPDVTVRMKGVMEKCSFCVQRIKAAHGDAKNEKRRIRDGEVQPACAQTCPTGALVFGNLADRESRVRKLTDDKRAYQVMGYLNTKTAVIYLKKVVREI